MTIKDIPAQEKYEGYLWMSDSTEPVVLDREPLPEDKISSPNPFVVEAELYDGANLCSFSVHHAGNEIICNRFQLTLDDRTSGHNEERVFKTTTSRTTRSCISSTAGNHSPTSCASRKERIPWMCCGLPGASSSDFIHSKSTNN